MKIRLRTLMAGPEGVFLPGTVIEPELEEAEALVAGGFAEPVDRPVETTAVEPGIRAVKPAPRPRKIS